MRWLSLEGETASKVRSAVRKWATYSIRATRPCLTSGERQEPPSWCSVPGCTTARSTSTVCGSSMTIFSGDGYRAVSNGHHCRSAVTAGYHPTAHPALRSSRRPDRVKNSTPGSTSRPTPHWIASTDLDGTLRCSRSPTAARGWALSSHIASLTALGCVKRWRMRRPRRPDQLACRRIAPAVAGPARGRPPNRARHPRYRPRRRRRGTVGPA
jgi:hypothetical protein